MTDSAVRTYALGDTVADGDYAGSPFDSGVCSQILAAIDSGVSGYGGCTLPVGHLGPQHVAATGPSGEHTVVGIAPRDTSGDEPKRYATGDTAPTDLRATVGNQCGRGVGDGYYCNLPAGHAGPQHLAIGSDTGHVYGVGDVPEPIVEQPTPEVVAERLRVVEEEVVRLRTIRDTLTTELDSLRMTHDEFRQTVVDKAMDLARRHDWCSVVQAGLEEMGLGDLLTRTYRVQVTVTATRTAYVEVEARESGDAWRMVDNMDASELSDLIDQQDSSYRFYGSGEWEHESHDASTDVDEV